MQTKLGRSWEKKFLLTMNGAGMNLKVRILYDSCQRGSFILDPKPYSLNIEGVLPSGCLGKSIKQNRVRGFHRAFPHSYIPLTH